MNEIAGVLLDLFFMYLLARIAAEAFERAGLPVVVGELAVGLAIGPHALGLIGLPSRGTVDFFGSPETARQGLDFVYDVVGQLGLIVLLFYAGLEMPFERLAAVAGRAIVVAVPGVALTFALGTGAMLALGHAFQPSLFVGSALAATSIAITTRALQSLGLTGSREGEIVLAAAVLDDVLALLLLAVVTDLAREGGINWVRLALVAGEISAFFVFAGLVARHLIGRFSLHLERLRLESPALVFALTLMLGMSAAAAQIGLAGIIGAFLAGIVLSESAEQLQLGEQTRPIYQFLAPFFFVITGARVDLGVFADAHLLVILGVLTAAAIGGKVVGCGLGGWGLGRRSMAFLGLAMVPRGEIGFAVASIGLALGVIDGGLFAAVVSVSIITALLAPVMLQRLRVDRETEGSVS
jgi:Kef-type K+ transport system membrane component KefB